jgi:hypothetical protein
MRQQIEKFRKKNWEVVDNEIFCGSSQLEAFQIIPSTETTSTDNFFIRN